MIDEKKILLVSFYWYPDTAVGILRPRRFANALKKLGWYVTVLTPDKGVAGEDRDFRVVRVKPADERFFDLLAWPFKFVGLRKFIRDGLLWRSRKFFTFPDPGTYSNRWCSSIIKKAAELAKAENYNAIWITTPPQFLIPAAVKIARRSKKPILLDMRDPWTHNFTFEYEGRRKKLCEKYEAKAAESLDAIVCVTPIDAETMRLRYPVAANRIHCVVNGYDAKDIPTAKHRDDDKFVLALMGQSYQEPAELFEGIEKACNKNPEFAKRFVFRWIGAADPDAKVRENIQLHPRCPHEQALDMAADADALWLEVPLGDTSKYVICSKTYEYLALKKTIIGTAPKLCCNRDIIDGICRNRFIDSRDSDDIAELLLWAFDKFLAGDFSANTDESKLDQFEAETLSKDFESILRGITGLR